MGSDLSSTRSNGDPPPPYQPWTSTSVQSESEADCAITAPSHPKPVIIPNDIVKIKLVGKTEVYQFSQTKLKARGCKGLLELANRSSSGTITLGHDKPSERNPVYADSNAPRAMDLLSQWVETGKLIPIIRHTSAPIFPYVALYIIAYELASEILCNSAMDELIGRFADINATPSVHFARWTLRMGGDCTPKQLKDMVLQFLLSDARNLVEDMVEMEADGYFIGKWDHALLLMMAQKAAGKGCLFVQPSWRTRCRFHIHQHTQPCGD